MRIFFLLLFLLFSEVSPCQSVILRPGIGLKFFNTKTDNALPNHFDPSFNGKRSFSNLAFTFAAELEFKKLSYELIFTSQQVSSAASVNVAKAQISQSHVENGGISQFQIVINRNFPNISISKNILPVFGLGFGLGINRPAVFYDSSYYTSRFYSTTSPGDFIDYSQTERSLSKISYSAVIKLGISIRKNNIERARIYALYNMGLNKIVQTDIVYYQTYDRYYGSGTAKGSQFSIMGTVPIYLKRNNK